MMSLWMLCLGCAAGLRHTIQTSMKAVGNHVSIVTSHQEDISNEDEWKDARFFESIAEAVCQARAGDTIYIEGGTYEENQITFLSSGSLEDGYIVVCPLPHSGSVILSQGRHENFDDKKPVFDLNNRSYIKIENLEFSEITDLLTCIKMKKASHCLVTGNIFKGIGKVDVSSTYDGNAILLLNNATDCVVSHNLFEDCYGDGVCLSEQNTKRNLICHNTFKGMKGKKRSWSDAKYSYSSAITCSDVSLGHNLMAFNQIEGGLAGIWLDRNGSHNFVVRNVGAGGQRLVFNESRCAFNWVYENKASHMTVSAYSSALYTDTGWSSDTRWVSNQAYDCKVGFYLHKSKRDTLIANVTQNSSSYCLVFSDSAASYGPHYFAGNEWDSSLGNQAVLYKDKTISVEDFCAFVGQKKDIVEEVKEEVPVGRCSTEYRSQVSVDFEPLVVVANPASSCELKLRLSSPATSPMMIQIKAVAGDALDALDYSLASSQLYFEVGETEKALTINVKNQNKCLSKLLLLQILDSEGKLCLGRCYSVIQILSNPENPSTRLDEPITEAENRVVRTAYFDLNGRKVSTNLRSHSILIRKTWMGNEVVKTAKIVR